MKTLIEIKEIISEIIDAIIQRRVITEFFMK